MKCAAYFIGAQLISLGNSVFFQLSFFAQLGYQKKQSYFFFESGMIKENRIRIKIEFVHSIEEFS